MPEDEAITKLPWYHLLVHGGTTITVTMLHDFSTRMKHAVQQENRSLTASIVQSSSSNGRSRRKKEVGLVIVLFVILLLVVAVLLFLQTYNAILQQYKDDNDHKMAEMLKLTEQEEEASKKDILVLSLTQQQQQQLGEIRIVLRPDLSKGSVEYIQKLVNFNKCDRCSLYRADQRGILQGIMKNANIPTNTERGPCPEGLSEVKNDCPDWDKQCGCHGPIMTRGAVAWAAGQAGGPDFFIDNYRVRVFVCVFVCVCVCVCVARRQN